MKSPLRYLALIGACLAPLAAAAQSNGPPGYTFGGMFPGMFGNNAYTVPQGYMNQGQSPFLTMPAPQFLGATSGQAQPAPFSASPMSQPTPFWMQTPPSPQSMARFITDIPSSFTPQNTRSPQFAPQAFTSSPPRWPPLPGQAPVSMQTRRPFNNWSLFSNSSQAPLPAVPATPPKWPTP